MNIETGYASGRLTVRLSGELDHHEARSVMEIIGENLDEYLPRECALDLSGLSFMDSSGIALLVNLHRRMQDLGGRVWIENPSVQARRVLDAAGIERFVQLAVIGGKA